jgi:hypothetical protein
MSQSNTLQENMAALAQKRDLFEQAKAYAYAHLDGVSERSVFPTESALAGLKSFDEPLPEEPGDHAAFAARIRFARHRCPHRWTLFWTVRALSSLPAR